MTNMKLEKPVTETNPIQTFTESRKGSDIFVQKEHGIHIYNLNTDQPNSQPIFKGDMPIVKLYQPSQPIQHRGQLILQEDESKIIFQGKSGAKDEVYYVDAATGKVISQYEHDGALDLDAVGGKESTEPGFVVLDKGGITRYDARIKNPRVKEKRYKSKVAFGKLATGPNQNLVVGSSTGDIRIFNKVGTNAKNVIPSLLGDPILDLDVSKYGDFVLATCQNYILLLPTFQNGASAFDKMFLKKEKPVPRVLRVDPKTLVRMGLGKITFKTGKFDVKEGLGESLIVGTAANCIVVWVLEDVLRNDCVSRRVKRVKEGIVVSKFKRNQDSIIAALKNDLVWQPTYGNRKSKKNAKKSQ